MTTGVVIIAKKHRMYANMAFNLAVSIKHTDPLLPICLIHDNCTNDYTTVQKFIFNKMILNNDSNPFKVKLSLFDLSPFDKTIYLDADMVMMPNHSITTLLESIKGFQIANRGFTDTNDWIDVNASKKEFNVKQWLNTSSEVIIFDKSEESKKVFELANEFYLANTLVNRKIGAEQPDEPSFSYAIAHSKIKMQIPFKPSFWEPQESKYINEVDIRSNFTFLSMGGNNISSRIQNIYNRYVQHYAYNVGVKSTPHVNKSTVLKERLFI